MRRSIDPKGKGQIIITFIPESKKDSKKLIPLHKALNLDDIVAETQAIGVFATTVFAGRRIDQFQITIPVPVDNS